MDGRSRSIVQAATFRNDRRKGDVVLLARMWWRALRRFVSTTDVDGIEFTDLRRGDRSDRSRIIQFLGDAIHDINWAGFEELLSSNLRAVVATDFPHRAIPAIRGYFCNFAEFLWNRRALSCRLLWFAKYYELTSGRRPTGAEMDAMALACYEVELEFVRRFPDSEQWIRFLEENHRPR